MNIYRTQRRRRRSGPDLPARLAFVLFNLALIGVLLAALTPAPEARRLAALRSSERVILLALSIPRAEIALPLNLASPLVAVKTPAVESEPRPSAQVPPVSAAEPIPPAPMAAVEIPVDDKAVGALEPPSANRASLDPSALLDVAEDSVALERETAIPAVSEPALEPESVIPAASEPALEPEPAPEEDVAPPIPGTAPPVADDDGGPAPYAVGELAPDEAAAMPQEAPTIAVAEKAPAVPPQPEQPAESPSDLAMARPAPIFLANARPSDDAGDRPRVAVVVTGLGLGRAATTAAIQLPGAITLAFASYARDLQKWIDLARSAGHEILLDLPMEPENYPAIDPGPQALLTSLSAAENAERLRWHLDRASGYVGVTHNMGSRFTASSDQMRPILSALKVRGLMFLDSRTSANSVAASLATAIGLPRAINNRFLDNQASRTAIDRRLDEIERIARRVGYSVAVSHAYPVTIDRLERWIESLDSKKLALVPVSALVNRQAAE